MRENWANVMCFGVAQVCHKFGSFFSTNADMLKYIYIYIFRNFFVLFYLQFVFFPITALCAVHQ